MGLTRKNWSCLALAVALALPRIAHADDVADEADLQFQIGADAYGKGEYRGALEHFLASNRLVPNKNVVFNIARSYEQMKMAPEAYRFYLEALDGETRADSKKRIEEALGRVASGVAVLRVITDPPGATVYLDRKDLGSRGSTPRALGLGAGRHKVLVELAGYEPALRDEVELRVGSETKVELKLVPIFGLVRIEGEVGGQVRVDSEDAAVACVIPCQLSMTPGSHVLVVTKPGYQTVDVRVEVPPRGSLVARAPMSVRTGKVVINTDITNALITIDDQAAGFTPSVLNVPVGHHKLRVSASGFRAIEREIDVDPTTQLDLDLDLAAHEEVTAASRVAETADDAPASVTIITQQELRAMGYPTIAEAIRGVRGLFLSDDTIYESVGVRGFSRPGDYGNRVLVLIDGHPANDNYVFSSYIGYDARVDLEDVERIEIVRGPGSVLYGTSAFFAVINLITRTREDKTHGEAGVSGGGNGVGRARATAYLRFSKDAGAWTSVSGAHGTGRDFFFPEFVGQPDPRRPGATYDGNVRGVDGFDAATVSGRAWFKSLTVQWFLTSRNKTIPAGLRGSVLGDARTHDADTRGFVEARFEPQISPSVQLLSRAHVDMYDFDGFSAAATPAQDPTQQGPERDTYRGRWGGLEQRILFSPSEAFRMTLGGTFIRHFQTFQRGENDVQSVVFDDKGNPGRNDPFSVAAGYANFDVSPVRALKLSAGARVDYYSSLDKFDFVSAFNPRLAVIVKPNEKGTIKALFGKAFRAPSVYELYFTAATQIRPQGLQPEQIYSGELEYSHRFTSAIVGTVAGYVSSVSNLIELNNVTQASGAIVNQYANSHSPVLIFGGEGELRREWRQGWMLSGSVTVSRARYTNAPDLREVPNSPLLLGSLKGAAPIVGRQLMLMSRLSFEGPRYDGNFHTADPAQATTDPGLVWDLVFSGEIEPLGARWAVGAYNLTNWKYDTVPSGEFTQRTIVQSGRTFLASLGARF